jgi:hypothetical protein
MATLWVFLSIISIVPALILYFLGVMLSPSLSVVAATWDLPLRVVVASMVLMVPTSALALCYSSMTQESRYAGFAWFITWILGWVTYMAATAGEAMRPRQSPEEQLALLDSPWTNLSLYHTLGKVQSWVFGFSTFEDVLAPVVILSGMTLVSLLVLLRRISAPMRV